MKFSVVLICNNWSPELFRTLESVKDLGSELLIYDSGKLDNLSEKVKSYGAKVTRGEWKNYGETRKKAYLLARYDWILAIDSDEIIDDTLRHSITQIDLNQEQIMYKFRFKNFVGKKEIKHGEWGNTRHIRLGNRKAATFKNMIVHEELVLKPGVHVKTLEGFVLHNTARNIEDYLHKMLIYAKLSSEKYQQEGRQASFLKLFFSPLFSFIKNYVFRLGFLDGWEGFLCAGMSSWYTFLKYAYLRERNKKRIPATFAPDRSNFYIEEDQWSN
ncbi:MAG: glycosyltransferase family 2 protein [Ferruginibacter sp.]